MCRTIAARKKQRAGGSQRRFGAGCEAVAWALVENSEVTAPSMRNITPAFRHFSSSESG